MKFENKKIIVTGGSRGIGAAIVRELTLRGAQVAFSYSSQESAAQKLLSEITESGSAKAHFCFPLQLTEPAQTEEALAAAFEKLGGCDGVVNNAGISKDQLLIRTKTEDFQSVIQTNLIGTFVVTKAAVKYFLKQRSGAIVNISSVIGSTGNIGQAAYAASKAGLSGLTKSVALEVASRGIRINSVSPGYIATDMTDKLSDQVKKEILSRIPLQRIAEPNEVAYAVLFLLSDLSSYVTGQTLHVNGGVFMN